MQKSSLIGHTIEAYAEFAKNSHIPADAVLRRFFLNRKYLGSGDRRVIASAYFGAIKNFLRLEAIINESVGRTLSPPAPTESRHHYELIVASYFILFENTSAEEMQKVTANLSNSFKHNYPLSLFELIANREEEEKRLSLLPQDERLSIFYSYPLWFVKEMEKEYGKDSAEVILRTLNTEAPTILRVNTLVSNREALRSELASHGIESELSKISPDGLILKKRMNVWDLKAFKDGWFEVQDEASQLVAPLADIHSKRIKILDACAGAGGKTLHLAALLENHGEIFATDTDSRKLEELKKRVVRSKAQNVRIVLPDNYEKILAGKSEWFDIVLLDVPCTGTGTLRRNPSIKWNLTEEMLSELIIKQRKIIEENLHFIKPGGKLLYATCSVLKSEGEEQIEWLIKHHPEFSIEEVKRTYPEQDECDGFFAARLKKQVSF